MRRAALVIALLALAGCGGGDDEPEHAGAFVTTLIRDLGSGTAKAWESLHPLHRERVPRARYVECESGDGFGGTVTKVDVLEVKEEPATIPAGSASSPRPPSRSESRSTCPRRTSPSDSR